MVKFKKLEKLFGKKDYKEEETKYGIEINLRMKIGSAMQIPKEVMNNSYKKLEKKIAKIFINEITKFIKYKKRLIEKW